MLKIEHVNKSFGSTRVLFDVSFNVQDGRILGLEFCLMSASTYKMDGF